MSAPPGTFSKKFGNVLDAEIRDARKRHEIARQTVCDDLSVRLVKAKAENNQGLASRIFAACELIEEIWPGSQKMER